MPRRAPHCSVLLSYAYHCYALQSDARVLAFLVRTCFKEGMIESLILKYAVEYGVDVNLIKAIVQVESGGRSLCMRYEPHLYTQYGKNPDVTDDARKYAAQTHISYETEVILRSSSLGLMQTLGQLCRELGHRGPLLDICRPELGIKFGVMQLARLMKRYPNDELSVIAAYNAGTARRLSDGKYFNQTYVDKVKSELDKLKGSL